MSRWFKEEWIDVCKLPKIVKCGRSKAQRKNYPYCRPRRKVNGKTPQTASGLSKSEIKRRCSKKKKNPYQKVGSKKKTSKFSSRKTRKPKKRYSRSRKPKKRHSRSIKRNSRNYRPTKSGAGMTKAGVAAYRKANPGSKLKTAVTGNPKPGSKNAKRRKSYCARSKGQWRRSKASTRNNPNSRINQSRRRWKCKN